MVELNFGTLLIAFIIVLVGIPLLVVVADAVWENTNTFGVTAEVLDVTAAKVDISQNASEIDASQTFSLANNQIVAVSAVTHNNGTVISEGTDWDFRNRGLGTVFLYNSSVNYGWISQDGNNALNQTNWTYTHGDNYIEGSAPARTFVDLLPLFFVIGLLLFVIARLFQGRIEDFFGR